MSFKEVWVYRAIKHDAVIEISRTVRGSLNDAAHYELTLREARKSGLFSTDNGTMDFSARLKETGEPVTVVKNVPCVFIGVDYEPSSRRGESVRILKAQ